MKHLENRNLNKVVRHIISGPFIYGLIISLLFVHVCFEIYHQIAFRLYNLDLVNYKVYVKIDRHRLSKLSFMEKINCIYCGYANGLLPYITKIAAETEKYWCGIKHSVSDDSEYIEPEHHKDFFEYTMYK